jgi:hypothetical protein
MTLVAPHSPQNSAKLRPYLPAVFGMTCEGHLARAKSTSAIDRRKNYCDRLVKSVLNAPGENQAKKDLDETAV